MTDKMKIRTKRNSRDKSDFRVAGTVWIAAAISLIWTTGALAQEAPLSARHFLDTNTDRIPALTAFPKYPSIARRDRIEGEATVCFKIRANGKVSRPIVTERSHRIFSKPALRAIRKSSFEPIGPGQMLSTARTCRIYRFRLDPILVRNSPPPRNN